MSETKPCECGCGATLTRKPDEAKSKWDERKYASVGCRNRGHAVIMKNKAGKAQPQQKTSYQRCVDAVATINAYWRRPVAYVTTCDGMYVVRSNLVNGVPV